MTTTELKKENILGVKVKNYGECEYCKSLDVKEELDIPWEVWTEWLYLMRQMEDKEWGAVFTVKDKVITGYKIPKQEVTGTACEFKEELGGDGMIHSHHKMGAFHSGQDDKAERNLYEYSIVLAHESVICTKKMKLPCGGYGYTPVDLTIIGVPQLDIENITIETYKDWRKDDDKAESKEITVLGVKDKEVIDHYGQGYAGYDELFPFCEYCDTYDCKTCKDAQGFDMKYVVPFCETCNLNNCEKCEKLDMYELHYPDEKGKYR